MFPKSLRNPIFSKIGFLRIESLCVTSVNNSSFTIKQKNPDQKIIVHN
jgi:hypothetical protein